MIKNSPLKILITAPSLNEAENVSGISTVVRQIITRSSLEYLHFTAGRTDGEQKSANWIAKQTILPLRFFRRLGRENVDVVHLNTAFNPLSIVRDYALAKAAKLANRALIVHLHGGKFLAEEFNNERLARIAEKMLRAADAVIVLSELEKIIIEKRWRNLNVKVLENAVAVDEAPAAKRGAGEKTLIFLGRMHESKGLHEIVESCRALKDENVEFRFRCFGAGAARDFFTGEMTKIIGEKFYYGGVIAGAEKWRELARADIFVLPSRGGEGLPMAMLEAMAAGAIPVVSEMASIGAVVRDGDNGFLIEPRNASQLTEKLNFLLSGQADWENLRKNARKTVADKFDLPEYITRLETIYREISN